MHFTPLLDCQISLENATNFGNKVLHIFQEKRRLFQGSKMASLTSPCQHSTLPSSRASFRSNLIVLIPDHVGIHCLAPCSRHEHQLCREMRVSEWFPSDIWVRDRSKRSVGVDRTGKAVGKPVQAYRLKNSVYSQGPLGVNPVEPFLPDPGFKCLLV